MLLKDTKQPTELKITHLNKRLDTRKKQLREALKESKQKSTGLKGLRELLSAKKNDKKTDKKDKKSTDKQGSLFVLEFDGDIKASAVKQLREEISLIIAEADAETDKVLIRLESPGGMVHGYGLAAAQLARLREAGFHLTVCIDKVAASGGYMMACIANEIISAPFAIVGSIGVVAQMPNFNKLLDKLNIDYDVYTAGEFKRTVTIFGEKDEAGVAKFKEELEQTHKLFKEFVEKYRPKLEVAKVATGEHWYGEDALALNLVDKLSTSDSYILDAIDEYDVYTITLKKKQTPLEKFGMQSANAMAEKLPNILFNLNHIIKNSVLRKD